MGNALYKCSLLLLVQEPFLRKVNIVMYSGVCGSEVSVSTSHAKGPWFEPRLSLGPCTHVYGTQPTVYTIFDLCVHVKEPLLVERSGQSGKNLIQGHETPI